MSMMQKGERVAEKSRPLRVLLAIVAAALMVLGAWTTAGLAGLVVFASAFLVGVAMFIAGIILAYVAASSRMR
ncbi:MAG: hypothetical protein ACE5PO_06380 [Candidatus Bathyarchaeia archaeon]